MTPTKPNKSRKCFESEKQFREKICCSNSCAKRLNNPIWKDGALKKMTETLKRIGHKPISQGGNGRGLTNAQEKILEILGAKWKPELAIKTNAGHRNGVYPNCYKVDIGNQDLKIAIEIDGSSHNGKRKLLDSKKDNFLKSLGWRVFRLKNQEALRLCTIYKSADTLLISLEGY